MPWVTDGIEPGEQAVVEAFERLSQVDPTLATVLSAHTWIQDGISHDEATAIPSLASVAEVSREMATELLSASWLVDGIANNEILKLESLGLVNAEIARLSWVVDGLDDREIAALLVLTRIPPNQAPNTYREMLLNHTIQTEAVSMPLSGEVTAWAFQLEPFPEGEDALWYIDYSAPAMEEFLGLLFPVDDIIMFILSPDSLELYQGSTSYGGSFGRSYETFFTTTRDQGYDGYEGPPPYWNDTYYGLAHYYFHHDRFGPLWLGAGIGSFLNAYMHEAFHRVHIELLTHTALGNARDNCFENGVSTIRALQLHGVLSHLSGLSLCPEYLGALFLLNIYQELGKDIVASSLRELYVLHKSESRPVTEEEIFHTFLNNAPTGQEDKFIEIYRLTHGGPCSDGEC